MEVARDVRNSGLDINNPSLSGDAIVLQQLSDLAPGQVYGETEFRNARIAELYNRAETAEGTRNLAYVMKEQGGFNIAVLETQWRDTDGEQNCLYHPKAADNTGMFPMGTHAWVRDIARIHANNLFSGDEARIAEGKTGLLSCLSVMSSVAQLDRFEKMIKSNDPEDLNIQDNWPHIFFSPREVVDGNGTVVFEANANTQVTENWTHRQDAWQMLAYYTLEAIEQDLITVNDLTDKHKKFLGSIVPFLAKVGFPNYENSGSWEDVPAYRSSVTAWEHRTIVKLDELTKRSGFDFLSERFNELKHSLKEPFSSRSFSDAVEQLDKAASAVMIEEIFKGEAVRDYSPSDVEYRPRDAAEFYLLEINYAEFLARQLEKTADFAPRAEASIVGRLEALVDPQTGGMKRYDEDSYQGLNYFLTKVRDQIFHGNQQAEEGDPTSFHRFRGAIVPPGREAAWTHPVWQVASWAAEKALDALNHRNSESYNRYRELHETFFKNGLRTETGEGEIALEVVEVIVDGNKSQETKVVKVPSWRSPECIISVKNPEDDLKNLEEGVFYLPSGHTPLNWATSEKIKAFDARLRLLQAKEALASQPQ